MTTRDDRSSTGERTDEPTAPDGGIPSPGGRTSTRREGRKEGLLTRAPVWLRADPGRVAWPALVALVALAMATVYLLTHPYPAYGAGLYLQIAGEILAHGYALPETVPGYTEGGVPFAYPPLVFYLAAVLLDLGVEPLAISRFLPAGFTVLYSVVGYYVARAFLPSRRQAGVAALLLAVTPDVLQWHLSAGGMVRGFGFLLSLLGLLVGVRVFRERRRRWALVGLGLFGLTVLTHPVYTAFFGLSWLLLYLWFDRTVRGLLAGAAVAAGGVSLAAPWWLQVAATHGPTVFFAAAGTHSGLGGGLWRFVEVFVLVDVDALLPFYLLAYAGVAWSLAKRRYFLPAWFLATGYVVGKDRFLFVAGSMMVAAFLVEGLLPWLRANVGLPDRRRAGTVALLAVVLVAAGVGGLFAASALDSAHDHSSTLPAFMDEADREAMAWTADHTDEEAQFVVLGDAAEWFPLFTDRTILVGYWGVEWTSPAEFEHQMETYETVSACNSAACVNGVLGGVAGSPDYVYVPKGDYTIRGQEASTEGMLHRSLEASPRYDAVHENEGVVLFRVREGVPGDRAKLQQATHGGS